MKKKKIGTILSLGASLSFLASCAGGSFPDSSPSISSTRKEENPDASLTLSASQTELYAGEELLLETSLSNAYYGEVFYESSDPSVLEVDQAGLVKALKAGTATVTASLENLSTPKSASVELSVVERSSSSFSVRFEDYDGAVLYETSVAGGTFASFQGLQPKRSADNQRAYVFSGWDKDPAVTPIREDTVFRATYQERPLSDFIFTPIAGSNAYMLYLYLGEDEAIEIPSLYQGAPVTRIDAGAFVGATKLKKITLPDSIGILADQAFAANETIQEVVLPSSIYDFGVGVFQNATALTKVTLPEGLVTLPERTFYGASSLAEVAFPSTLSSIGNGAFYDCTSLSSITLPDSVTIIGDDAFRGCEALTSFTAPASLKSIGEYAFRENASLKAVDFKGKITSIPRYAFYDSSALEEFNFQGVSSIEERAFYGTGFKTLILPDAITSIGDYAFTDNKSLTSVTYTKGVSTLPSNVFAGCDTLTSVANIDHITAIGDAAFQNTGLTKVDASLIPSKVTSIGQFAFMGVKAVEATVPGNVKTLGPRVFQNNPTLEKVVFQEGVESIGENQFYNTPNLKTVVFPASLTSYGSASSPLLFNESKAIESIDLKANPKSNAKSIGGVVYSQDGKKLLEYPAGRKDASYKVADSASSLASHSLAFAANLKTIDLNGVQEIASDAMTDSGLTSLNIPKTVQSIGARAFQRSLSLAEVTFASDSPITEIPAYLFDGAAALEKASLPTKVASIGAGAFESARALASIHLPKTLTEIGSNAFANAPNLVANYEGTKAEFLNVTVASTAFAKGAKVVCSDGEISY